MQKSMGSQRVGHNLVTEQQQMFNTYLDHLYLLFINFLLKKKIYIYNAGILYMVIFLLNLFFKIEIISFILRILRFRKSSLRIQVSLPARS